MQAVYLGVDEPTLDRLVALDADDLPDVLEQLQESGAPAVQLAKAWDGLHYLLTGATAADPIDEHPLSESVVGVHVFDGDDYTACTEWGELARILDALDAVDLDALLSSADYAAFARAGVSPNIWSDAPRVLDAELREAFAELRGFHRRCLADQLHLIVSII